MKRSIISCVAFCVCANFSIFPQDSGETVPNENTTPTEVTPAEPTPEISDAQPSEENAIPDGKVIARYKFGKIQKSKLLKQQKAQLMRAGYRGQQLANRLRGAEMGIEMGISSMGVNWELRDNGYYYTIKDGEPTSPKKYRIVGNTFQIDGKDSGNFKTFAKFGPGRKTLIILNSDAVLERY